MYTFEIKFVLFCSVHMEISLLLQFSAILNEAFIKIGSTELCSIV